MTNIIPRDPASVVDIADGARIARMGDIICAAYNKPEAIKHWLHDHQKHGMVGYGREDSMLPLFPPAPQPYRPTAPLSRYLATPPPHHNDRHLARCFNAHDLHVRGRQ